MIITMLIKRRKIIIYFMSLEWFFIWTNLNPLHPRRHCVKCCWFWPHDFWEDFLKIVVNVFFSFFVIISPCNRARPFNRANLIYLHPRMICDKFGWNWSSGSGEEDENVKSLRQQRQRWRQITDKFWWDGSLEPSVQVS